MTQMELAKRTGTNLGYLADIEMNNRNSGIDTFEKLIYSLETNCENFFKGIKQLSAETHRHAHDAGIR